MFQSVYELLHTLCVCICTFIAFFFPAQCSYVLVLFIDSICSESKQRSLSIGSVHLASEFTFYERLLSRREMIV